MGIGSLTYDDVDWKGKGKAIEGGEEASRATRLWRESRARAKTDRGSWDYGERQVTRIGTR